MKIPKEKQEQIKNLLKEAYAYEENGLIEEACKNYKKCISFDDGDAPEHEEEWESKKGIFIAWLHYSSLLKEQKKWAKALEAAKQATVYEEISDLAYSSIGECCQEIGEPIKAEKAFQQAIKIKPRTEFWVLLYQLLHNHFKNRENEAIKCLYSALELDPDNEEALYLLGIHFRMKGDYEKAEELLRKAIKIDPQYGKAYGELAWVIYSEYSKQEKVDKALYDKVEKYLTESISLDPSYGGSRLYLAFIFERQRRIRNANEQYKKLLNIWPDNSISHWAYGDFLARSGNQKQAEYYLKRAVEIDPEDSEAYYFLGKALMIWKRYPEAYNYLTEADKKGHNLAQTILSEFNEYVNSGEHNSDSFNEKMFSKYGLF